MLKITVLMNDRPSRNRSLLCSHGLSILVEKSGYKLLFDFGPDWGFLNNAERLGIDLDNLDAAILSHGHYDHASGFLDFIAHGFSVPVLYVGKGFDDKKYSQHGVVFSDLSSPWNQQTALSHGIPVKEISDTLEVLPDIFVIGDFPRLHSDEIIPSRYVRYSGEKIVADDFSDEIALAIKTDNGIVLIVGCSHVGIKNIVDATIQRFGKVSTLIGGIHLSAADDKRISSTLDYLREKGITPFLCHCSGEKAEKECERIGVGDTLFFV